MRSKCIKDHWGKRYRPKCIKDHWGNQYRVTDSVVRDGKLYLVCHSSTPICAKDEDTDWDDLSHPDHAQLIPVEALTEEVEIMVPKYEVVE